jgi:hypothetical protein
MKFFLGASQNNSQMAQKAAGTIEYQNTTNPKKKSLQVERTKIYAQTTLFDSRPTAEQWIFFRKN